MCKKLDTGSEAPSNERGDSGHPCSAFGNWLLAKMHRALLRPSCPGVQFGREACRSENIESFKTPLSEEL